MGEIIRMEGNPVKINGAKFTITMTTGLETVCSEGNYESADLYISVKYDKTAEELKALADQGDVSWSPVEGIQGWEDGQIRLVKMVQENLVNFYEEADGLNAGTARELTSIINEEYPDESSILYHASYDKEKDEVDIFVATDEITDGMIDHEIVKYHTIITKESFKKER